MKKRYLIILIIIILLLTGCSENNNKKQIFYEAFNDDLAVVINSDGYYQYVNYKEQNPFKDVYEYATNFSNNSAIVRKNKKEYLINRLGEIISDKYDYIDQINSSSKDGLPIYPWILYVAQLGDKYHYLDENGKKFIDLEFTYASSYTRSDMLYGKIGDEYVVFNKEGKEVLRIDNIYSISIGHFNTILVRKTRDCYDIYDNQGNLLLENYEDIREKSQDIIRVTKNGVSQYVNKKGEVFFSEYEDISIENNMIFGQENGLWYLINMDGSKILEEGYEYVNSRDNFIKCTREDKIHIIPNNEVKILGDRFFDEIEETEKYLICFEKNENEEYKNIFIYDNNGNLVFEKDILNNYEYSEYFIDAVTNDIYLTYFVNGKKKLYNISEKTIHDTYSDEIRKIINGIIIYNEVVDGKNMSYFIKGSNKIMLPYYENIKRVSGNIILYSIDGKVGLDNGYGEKILSCKYYMIPSISYHIVY